MASNLSDASLKAPFLIPGGSPLARMSSFSTGWARDEEKRRVVAECYQPGVSVSVVARRHDRSRYGRWRFRRVSEYRMAAASEIFAETLGSCVRHLVTDHLKTGADRRWLISHFFPNHRTTIGANSASSSAAGKNQTAFPRQTTTARQLARIETVSPCNTRHRIAPASIVSATIRAFNLSGQRRRPPDTDKLLRY